MTVATAETITAKEIAEVAGITKRSVHRRSEKERWPYQDGPNRSKLFIIAKLPDDIRIRLSKPAEPTLLYSNDRLPVPVGSPDLTMRQNKVGLARADLVRMYLAEKKKARLNKQPVCDAAERFIAGYNTGALSPNLFSILKTTSVKTVERWALTFKRANFDYTAIADNYGNRMGQRKITPDELNTALSFCLHPNRLRISEAVRMTKITLERRGVLSPSSDSTIRRVIHDWKNNHYDRWVFCREGEKALNDKVLPYIDRDAGLLDVGDVLVADGHMLNFEILHPFTGKPARMAMVLWYDWASRKAAGWEIMPTENIQCVASSLRHAILKLGKVPKVAYLDNGRAFKARVFTSTDIDFEEAGFYGMFARIGIEAVFAWAYHGQSKPVERFFGTFSELERLTPTFSGTSIADKPARMMRNETLHRKLHEQRYGGFIPTIDQANQMIATWMEEYEQRPHSGLKGVAPIEIWNSGKGPGIDEELLTHMMMHMKIKTVGRNGVRFMGRDYYHEDLYGYRERVMIRYDFDDLSRVHVFDQTGARKICTAGCVQGAHPMARLLGTKEDLALVKNEIEKKRRLKKTTEIDARRYVEDAPALVQIPEKTEIPANVKSEPAPMPRGEAERIEAEAAKMEVIEFKPKAPEPMPMNDPDRYEMLLKRECKGEELPLDDLQFMRFFEKTTVYRDSKNYFEMMIEHWIAGPETIDAVN